MPRSLVTALAMTAVLAGQLAAQGYGSFGARVGPQTETLLRSVLDSAAHDSLPVGALEAKALEGTAKGRPPAEIAAVVRRLAGRFREARSVLAGAAPSVPVPAKDVVTAAEAIASGAPPKDIAQLRRDAPPGTSLEIPFAVLGELVQRGVPAAQARDAIGHLLQSKVPETRIVEIPARMDAGIRLGAPPTAALGRALHGLGLPLPASVRQSPGKGRGRGRGGS